MDGRVNWHYYDYHEIKEHAGRDFPFNIYPCSIPLDFKLVPVHWHEEMEIISVKKGRGLVTDRGCGCCISGTAAWNQPDGRGGNGI